MPELDLIRANHAIREAARLLRVTLPASYPADPAAAYREHAGGPRAWANVELVAQAAEDLLQRAVAREREAQQAQELAVEALRSLGRASSSWSRVGALLGISGQGAHKRFRRAAEQPRAELTIDDELEVNGSNGPKDATG